MKEKEKILEALKSVVDPEIGIDIVNLGLIYDIKIKNKKAEILMTLTSLFCPYGNLVVEMVERKIREIGYEPKIQITFDPPWTPDKMSEEAKKKLGFL